MLRNKLVIIAVAVSMMSTAFVGEILAKTTVPPVRSAKATPVVGMAKFVLGGIAVATGSNTLTVHVRSTSKNVAMFKGKDQVLVLDTATKITKESKKIPLTAIVQGSKVKVFGIFDAKSGTIQKVRWIKVLPK